MSLKILNEQIAVLSQGTLLRKRLSAFVMQSGTETHRIKFSLIDESEDPDKLVLLIQIQTVRIYSDGQTLVCMQASFPVDAIPTIRNHMVKKGVFKKFYIMFRERKLEAIFNAHSICVMPFRETMGG